MPIKKYKPTSAGRRFASVDTFEDVTSRKPEDILAECERGEDVAVSNYQDALKQDLPQDIRTLLDTQYRQVQDAHDRVRTKLHNIQRHREDKPSFNY
ncbi:MAG TPA: PA2169 family four-helix-bundle protein [bacterium]|nr:PA2169 family four-helix-bundle protein [bacterium]